MLDLPLPFGPYLLLERLRAGGMAEIFLAAHLGSPPGRPALALKRPLPFAAADPELARLFADEADILRRLDHPNVPRAFDAGQVDGAPYLAMEYVPGVNARALLNRAAEGGPLAPCAVAAAVARDAARGLASAHDARDEDGLPMALVHRDVSPSNLLVGFDGRTRVLDFGVAYARRRRSRDPVGAIQGKFGYLSPEQARGWSVDQRSDVFSLGVVLWELLAGRRLFVGDNPEETLRQVESAPIPPPEDLRPDVPPELSRIVLLALRRDPRERAPDAETLARDLDAWLRRSLDGDADAVARWLHAGWPEERRAALALAQAVATLDLAPYAAPARVAPSAPSSPTVATTAEPPTLILAAPPRRRRVWLLAALLVALLAAAWIAARTG